MNERDHEEIRSLLGAFALNATDAVEHGRIERHLATCDECANEVRMLTATAAELSWLTDPADADEVIERVASKLPARRRRIVTRLSVAVAAVSVAAAGVLGGVLVNERSENDRFADIVAGSVRSVRLAPQNGFDGTGVLYIARNEAALILENVPDAGRERAYQLWAIDGVKPRSLGVIDGSGRVVRIVDDPGTADRYAVTIEAEGGSPVPTTDPVLVGA